MDPDTTEQTPELLRLLVARHDERMGMYCRVVKPGRVAVGDYVG
jgi:MOSC domain-containing protein YiiM